MTNNLSLTGSGVTTNTSLLCVNRLTLILKVLVLPLAHIYGAAMKFTNLTFDMPSFDKLVIELISPSSLLTVI